MRREAELWNGRGLLPRRNGEDVCKPIRDAILETGMTNRQIAAACRVFQSQVSQAIHHTDKVGYPALRRICNFLCLDVSEVCPDRKEVRRDRVAAMTYGTICKEVRNNANKRAVYDSERAALAYRLMECLTERQREVVMMRCGFYGRYPMTFVEIGRVFNCSKNLVRIIEMKALRSIRKWLHRDSNSPAWMLDCKEQPLTEFGEMLKGLAA